MCVAKDEPGGDKINNYRRFRKIA